MGKYLIEMETDLYKQPNSKKFDKLLRILEKHSKQFKYPNAVKQLAFNYAVVKYRSYLQPIQWDMMLSRLDDVINVELRKLLIEMQSSVINGKYSLISDEFYSKYKDFCNDEDITDYIF